MDGKNCKRCNTWKPVSEFNPNPLMRDSLNSNCKHCIQDMRRPVAIKQCMQTGKPVAECRCYIYDRRPRGGITLTP